MTEALSQKAEMAAQLKAIKETDTTDPIEMVRMVRVIVTRELEFLYSMPILGEDGIDKLAKIALVLQRIRPPAPAAENNSEFTDKQLMKKARENE